MVNIRIGVTSLGLYHVSYSMHNIKIQRAGAKALYWRLNLPAADLGVNLIASTIYV
jgi:hypothetical protein